MIAPFVLGRGMLRRKVIDTQALLGALSIYLLAGIAFAMAYRIMALLQSTPLFTLPDGRAGDGTISDQMYFSFVTLSTTGYGDITARVGNARAFALLEAIGGQLYLLTAVAAILGVLVSRRAERE